MANERLRAAMARGHVSVTELATYTERDPKTVSRWLAGRVPHPRTRYLIAKRLKEDEEFLWPGANRGSANADAGVTEIVAAYPHRASVPSGLWDRLLEQAKTYVDVLVYVGMFMTEKPHLLTTLRQKALAGTRSPQRSTTPSRSSARSPTFAASLSGCTTRRSTTPSIDSTTR